jgi:hypothetical protein
MILQPVHSGTNLNKTIPVTSFYKEYHLPSIHVTNHTNYQLPTKHVTTHVLKYQP